MDRNPRAERSEKIRKLRDTITKQEQEQVQANLAIQRNSAYLLELDKEYQKARAELIAALEAELADLKGKKA
jgi:hypothetical protein